MKKNFTLLLIIAALLAITSSIVFGQRVRGNGQTEKEVRETSNFEGIKSSGGINVYLFQSSETKVIVEADQNLHEFIETAVKNNILHCSVNGSITHKNKINIYVSTPTVNSLWASSSAGIFGETLITSKNLNIRASSSADIKLEILAENVSCTASSSANIELLGSCINFNAEASSSADIKTKNLSANNAVLNASSASDISLTVNESLKASASSASDIVFYGNPESLSIKESSAGKVRQFQ